MWVEKVKQAIHRSKRSMPLATAKHGQRVLERLAPQGVRSGTKALRRSGIIHSFADQATLSIRADNRKVGLVNELGMSEPKYLRFDQFPELRDWAIKKYWAYNDKMKGLTVGKPETTRFGKQNVFWLPTYERMAKDLPRIMKKEIEQELRKVR